MAIFQRIFKNILSDPTDYYRIELTPQAYPQVEGMTPKELYATQSNVYAVVSFLADSIAQLPLKVYVRNGEDRMRDRNSVASKLLWRPNADQTAYELWNAVAIEYLLNGMALLWLLPDPRSESGYQLRLLPKEWITDSESDSAYALASVTVSARGGAPAVKIPKTDFIQFRMYAPGSPGSFQSPMSALKQTLREQIQADKFRTQIWRSSGRFNAYITRPKDVAPWDDETKKRWVEAFREGWSSNGSSAGKMPLLEDGMEIKPYQFNSKDAQYAETKQLSREDVAAAYHVNPSLIWHTSTQTYASAKDNARALYADCLGPTIQMLQQRINSFLLPMIGANPNTYVVFDLGEKLKGSFEERASILQSAVGAPYMTRNEARADSNLPPIEGGDELIVPLNVNDGINNPAINIEESTEPKMRYMNVKSDDVRLKAKTSDTEAEKIEAVIRKFTERQAKSIIPKISAGSEWWDEDRWNDELSEDLNPIIQEIANTHGKEIAKILKSGYDTERTENYIKALVKGRAKAINVATKNHLEKALAEAEEGEEIDFVKHAMEKRAGNDARLMGINLGTVVACWAIGEASRQAKDQGFKHEILKTWVTGENPREEHAMMSGETVPYDEKFSNGAEWIGDDVLGADGTCGCNCQIEITIRR